MKKLLSLIMLLMAIVTGAQAQDLSTYGWIKDSNFGDYIKEWTDEGVTLSSSATSWGGNSTVEGFEKNIHYIALSGNASALNASYFGVASSNVITKISFFIATNESSAGTYNYSVALLGWGTTAPGDKDAITAGTTFTINGAKKEPAWVDVDLSTYSLKSVRIYRKIAKSATGLDSDLGQGKTANVYGVKVWLSSGTTHTVTYDLGAATAGTAPTQDAVGEGSKFTVANAPTDLVAPEGKDFKCWNDGTDDYSEGDKYTMGTSDVILTAVYADKYAVSYAAGEGTGSMDGDEVAEGKKITLPASTFTAPAGKTFKNWLCSADNTTYAAGAEYTMTAEATTFTAQYANLKVVYSLVDGIGSAEVTEATATVNEGESLVLSNTSGRIKISAPEGQTFKAGDFITFTGSVGTTADNKKPFGIKYGATTSLGTTLKYSENVSADDGDLTVSGTLTLSEDASEIYIGREGGTTTTLIDMVISRIMETETITIPSDGVLTYVTQNAVDFSTQNGAFKAYVVTATSTTSATTAEVTAVPAGTPLLIKGAEGNYEVEVVESAEAPEANLLQVATADPAVIGGDNIYAYSKSAKKFKKVAAAVTIPAGKCYLEIEGGGPDALDIDFDGEATAIGNVNANDNANFAPVKVLTAKGVQIGKFNVAGQQVK